MIIFLKSQIPALCFITDVRDVCCSIAAVRFLRLATPSFGHYILNSIFVATFVCRLAVNKPSAQLFSHL